MARISDLIPLVRTHMSGAPEMMVQLYLRAAAKQFCQDTLVWDPPIGSEVVQSDVDRRRKYPIYNGTNVKGPWVAGAHDVDDIVEVDGQRYLCIVARTAADTDPPADDAVGWRAVSFVAPAQSYVNAVTKAEILPTGEMEPRRVEDRYIRYDIKTQMLTLLPGAITTGGELEVFTVLEPTLTAKVLPDFLAERWGQGIADYAIFSMFLMPKQEWSDPELAEVFRDRYVRRVSEAQIQRAREGTTKTVEVEPIPFV